MAAPEQGMDDAVGCAQSWRALAGLHARIEQRLERALQAAHRLSVVEYSVLELLSRQERWHMRMQQLAGAVVLSQSATTRLVARMEEQGLLSRYLCENDRRGIFTEVTEAGLKLLAEARPTHDQALRQAMHDAEQLPEFTSLVRALRDQAA
ncbi:DNA-binding MarR family transcriptional regulator [Actinoplanes campanulatus]|uniref:DNA-binding MarR family transcriptional regulator n=1 Tax=Actinoplanes campanulatus TaxID=113559 RepID=A0A7W5FEW1_9ACTN|nr:MarR family transcriptional regulator [Actinoplanes campanulatus]MBB3095874.1 DNA-binding MarR family transcriptional regulator [Actinoplanes campanulatus]